MSGPYTVTILAGQTSASFNLRINNDNNTFEGNETFSLTIRTSSLPDRVMTLPMCRLDATIVDNDCELIVQLCYELLSHKTISHKILTKCS